MLYRNILKHEAGFDYEFEEGVLVNITHMSVGDDGELDFEIDSEIACATVEEFKASWAPVLDNDSVKNLQKEWAKRIEEDKRFLEDDMITAAKICVADLYITFETMYEDRGYDLHASVVRLNEAIKTWHERSNHSYVYYIYKDFAELWIAQHM